MTQTTIRQVPGDEMPEIQYWLNAYAHQPSPPLGDKARWQEIAKMRQGVVYFVLYEDGRPVATVAGTPMIQQVRGAMFSMGGIMGVATETAARRKGYSRRLLARLLQTLRDDGRPLSCLYPFRESFYERMGYVTFPLPRTAKFSPLALLPLLERDLGGEVEIVLIGDGYDDYHSFVLEQQRCTHGWALFEKSQKAAAQSIQQWLALARAGGELVGVMVYALRGDTVAEFKLRASRFYYSTSQGKYLLLEWIARHADQADQVEIQLPHFEQPETWLADIKVSTESAIRAPMGRIVDVANIGGLRTGGPGRFSARITDALCPWNQGAWQFESVGGELQVSAAQDVDCDLSIHALAALVYGTHDPGDWSFRGWGNPSPEVQEIMRAMFPPMQPYLHQFF